MTHETLTRLVIAIITLLALPIIVVAALVICIWVSVKPKTFAVALDY